MRTSVLSGYGKIKLSFVDRLIDVTFEHFQETKKYYYSTSEYPDYGIPLPSNSVIEEMVTEGYTIFTLDTEQELNIVETENKYITHYELVITQMYSGIEPKPSFIFSTDDHSFLNKKFFCVETDTKLPVELYQSSINFDAIELVAYDFNKDLKIYVI